MRIKHFFVFSMVAVCCAMMQTGCTFDWPVSDSGKCGNNIQWTLDYETGVLVLSGSGPMNKSPFNDQSRQRELVKCVIISDKITSIYKKAFNYCINMTSVSIPNSVNSIGSDAFASCEKLTSVTIPHNVTSIEKGAFLLDSLMIVTNYATNPPILVEGGGDVFSSYTYNFGELYVPAESISLYKNQTGWKRFHKIFPIKE